VILFFVLLNTVGLAYIIWRLNKMTELESWQKTLADVQESVDAMTAFITDEFPVLLEALVEAVKGGGGEAERLAIATAISDAVRPLRAQPDAMRILMASIQEGAQQGGGTGTPGGPPGGP
jgi:hypothetical protein